MKAHLMGFAFTAILIAGIGMTPAFGQIIQGPITVTTDKTSYAEGDVIIISGEVRDIHTGHAITITVVDLDTGNRVYVGQQNPGPDKKFSDQTVAGGAMQAQGAYIVTVTYGAQSRVATATFDFEGSTGITPPKNERDPGVTDTTVLVTGADDLITYEITGGKLLSIVPDVDSKSLVINIEATDDGMLTLTIPRTVFDSVDEEGNDKDVFVLVDLEEFSEFEETTTSTDRTLTIEFSKGTEVIELIGTFVVPEFGTIAAMILAVAIISIIAISAKSRLSIIPRY